MLLCAAHGDVSLPIEAFRDSSHEDLGCSLQPLLHSLAMVAAPAKLCLPFGRIEEAPSRAIFPKRAGLAARSPRQVQTTPAKGRQSRVLTLRLPRKEMGHGPCQRALSQQLRLGKMVTSHMVHSLPSFPTARMLYVFC